MTFAVVKMPLEEWEQFIKEGTEWTLVETYTETEEINKLEVLIRERREELKHLNKTLFELKHPKK